MTNPVATSQRNSQFALHDSVATRKIYERFKTLVELFFHSGTTTANVVLVVMINDRSGIIASVINFILWFNTTPLGLFLQSLGVSGAASVLVGGMPYGLLLAGMLVAGVLLFAMITMVLNWCLTQIHRLFGISDYDGTALQSAASFAAWAGVTAAVYVNPINAFIGALVANVMYYLATVGIKLIVKGDTAKGETVLAVVGAFVGFCVAWLTVGWALWPIFLASITGMCITTLGGGVLALFKLSNTRYGASEIWLPPLIAVKGSFLGVHIASILYAAGYFAQYPYAKTLLVAGGLGIVVAGGVGLLIAVAPLPPKSWFSGLNDDEYRFVISKIKVPSVMWMTLGGWVAGTVAMAIATEFALSALYTLSLVITGTIGGGVLVSGLVLCVTYHRVQSALAILENKPVEEKLFEVNRLWITGAQSGFIGVSISLAVVLFWTSPWVSLFIVPLVTLLAFGAMSIQQYWNNLMDWVIEPAEKFTTNSSTEVMKLALTGASKFQKALGKNKKSGDGADDRLALPKTIKKGRRSISPDAGVLSCSSPVCQRGSRPKKTDNRRVFTMPVVHAATRRQA